MRVLGAAPRVPSPKEPVPISLRLASPTSTAPSFLSNDDSTTCFNTWRTRNADEDDERIALANWPSSSSSSPISTSTCVTTTTTTKTLSVSSKLSPSMEPWVTAFLLVSFDHDAGPVLEACQPSDALTQAEVDMICYHAMPDSASMTSPLPSSFHYRHHDKHKKKQRSNSNTAFCQDVYFSFRVPRRLNSDEEQDSSISVASTRLLLAHALFRQAPDQSSTRGALQKSIIVVTSTPYVSLPTLLLSLLAPKVFVYGRPVLVHAVRDISAWPDPRISRQIHNDKRVTILLPFVDDLVSVEWTESFLTSFACATAKVYVPHGVSSMLLLSPTPSLLFPSPSSPITPLSSNDDDDDDDDNNNNNNNNENYDNIWNVSSLTCTHPGAMRASITCAWPLVQPSMHAGASIFHEINPVLALCSALDLLPSIWEVIALGEPLLVVSSSPTACSSTVMSLLSLLHPLPFVGDWRPYFCMQDTDYERIVNATNVVDLFPDGAVFGVCNRLMADTMKFPHVLYLPHHNHHQYHHHHRHHQNDTKTQVQTLLSTARAKLVSTHQQHRTAFQRCPKSIKQLAVRVLVAHIQRDQVKVTESVRMFRLAFYDKITRPFLRVFERYLTPCVTSYATKRNIGVGNGNGNGNSHGVATLFFNEDHRIVNFIDNDNDYNINYTGDENNRKVLRGFKLPLNSNNPIPFGSYHHNNSNNHHYHSTTTTIEPYALDPFDRQLTLLPFNRHSFPQHEDFIMSQRSSSTLFKRGASSRVRAMYQRFLQGAVFREWWHDAVIKAERECRKRHHRHLREACARGVTIVVHALHVRATHHSEVVDLVVDLATRIRREAIRCGKDGDADENEELVFMLKREFNFVVDGLPAHKKELFDLD